MVFETGSASLLLENLINVHTNINMNNLILVLKEVLDASANNSVRIAALEQSFVSQSDLRKHLVSIRDDVKGTLGDSFSEQNNMVLDLVRKDIQQHLKKMVDREVSSLSAEISDHKLKYAEKVQELDLSIQNYHKSSLDSTTKESKKLTSLKQMMDRLEYRTGKLFIP